MILALSSSCDWCSAALFDQKGQLQQALSRYAPRQASRACLEMIDQFEVAISEISRYVVNTGPGSFAGTRVAVMLAKTLAWQNDKPIAGISAFELVSHTEPVVIPNKRGESFLRMPGEEVTMIQTGDPIPANSLGYGERISEPTYPDASRAQIDNLHWTDAMSFTMTYLVEPSISTPKKPYANAHHSP